MRDAGPVSHRLGAPSSAVPSPGRLRPPDRLPRRGLPAALVVAAVAVSVCSQTAGAGPGRSSPAGRPPVIGTSPVALPETYRDPSAPVGPRVADLLSRMTLAEKVGQMTQTERENATNVPDLVTTLAVGSVMSGAGSGPSENTPAAWADMVDDFQRQALRTRLGIPVLYALDSAHGHANLRGATVFPHNIGLGAAYDPDLQRRIGHITAEETRATGPQWSFDPCLCSVQDDRWGRSYESYSEDPNRVVALETIYDGLQGTGAEKYAADRVLATAKHFAGDGLTQFGSSTNPDGYTIDQGTAITDQAGLWEKAIKQYLPAVRRYDVGTIMPSYSSVDLTENGIGDPIKMHANRDLLTGVLKHRLGFEGFLISDWAAIRSIPDPQAPEETELTGYKVRTAVNAGIDMAGEPHAADRFVRLLAEEVEAGRVPMSRIDDAVRRILTAKFELGLFEHPFTDRSRLDRIGSPEHRAVARRAVAESQVLLRNEHGALPLRRSGEIYVAGSASDDLGRQAGGWTVTWQGDSGDTIEGTSILEGLRALAPDARIVHSVDGTAPVGEAQVAVVAVGEMPYAEGYGDVGGPAWPWSEHPHPSHTMTLTDEDARTVERVCSQVETCVVTLISGRPLVLEPRTFAEVDALVASWLPGSEGAGLADVLFGERQFTGRLPVTWPRSLDQEPINVGDADYDPLFPYGWGLTTRGTATAGTGTDRTIVQRAFRTADSTGSPAKAVHARRIALAEERLVFGSLPSEVRAMIGLGPR
ncbi:MAG: beta-glucosidase [Actinomycetota bacterium]|nr:beta-glucosidase [Actinomycetota bacterium]